MSKSLSLSIHSLVTINAFELPEKVKDYLLERLGSFVIADNKDSADITIKLLPDSHNFTLSESLIYNFWLTEFQGQKTIAFTYRGEAVIAVVLSEHMSILFRPVKKIAEKLYTLLLYCIHLQLLRRNALLFHGALAVSKNKNKRVVLTGPRSSKKTSLLLNLLRDGWHYLSDDKFILNKQNAYCFQGQIILYQHHIDVLPWLLQHHSNLASLNHWRVVRTRFKHLSLNHLPNCFNQALEPYYNHSLKLSVQELFPGSQIVNCAQPNIVVVLIFGLVFELKLVSLEEVLSDLTSIQSLAFYKFFQFEKVLSLIDSSYTFKLDEIIQTNLKQAQFFKCTIPYDYNIEQAYKELSICLNSA